MRPATISALLASLLLSLLPSQSSPAPAYECEGNACSSVTLTWEEDGQRFRADNTSDRAVKVGVTTYAGESSVSVGAHKSDYLQVTYFNGPYRAAYE